MPKEKANRVWELDFLRGIALILMIYFHVIYDMKDIYNYNVNYSSGINYYLGKASGSLFILLAGISCYLSSSNLKRGLKLLGLAMMITFATHLYDPAFGIKFGILHFLSVCILLAPVLRKLNGYLLLGLGTAMIVLKESIAGIEVSHNYLFMFGLYNADFISSDYYPLIPWMGVFLFGLAAGKLFYRERNSLLPFSLGDNPVSKAGRHTLWIYMVHQPVIIIVLTLVNRMLKG